MFITTKYSGYNRHGEQSAAGRFLILLQPKLESTKYPHRADWCQVCGIREDKHPTENFFPDCDEHGIVARLRKLNELKGTPEYEALREEMKDQWEKNSGQGHEVAGCPKCDAYKAYRATCRTFRPATNNKYPLRAVVRYVRMTQLGHFMMGTARIGAHRLSLSGSYGSDGLPCSVPDEVYEAGVELPQELYNLWNTGGGWNGAGSEAIAMRLWALATFPRTKADVLRRLRAAR